MTNGHSELPEIPDADRAALSSLVEGADDEALAARLESDEALRADLAGQVAVDRLLRARGAAELDLSAAVTGALVARRQARRWRVGLAAAAVLMAALYAGWPADETAASPDLTAALAAAVEALDRGDWPAARARLAAARGLGEEATIDALTALARPHRRPPEEPRTIARLVARADRLRGLDGVWRDSGVAAYAARQHARWTREAAAARQVAAADALLAQRKYAEALAAYRAVDAGSALAGTRSGQVARCTLALEERARNARLLAQGEALAREGKLDAAREALAGIRAGSPEASAARRLLRRMERDAARHAARREAEGLFRAGDADGALRLLASADDAASQALRATIERARALYEEARQLTDRRQVAEAATRWKALKALVGGDPEHQFYRWAVAAEQGRRTPYRGPLADVQDPGLAVKTKADLGNDPDRIREYVDGLFHYGLRLWDSGQRERARQYWGIVRAHYPEARKQLEIVDAKIAGEDVDQGHGAIAKKDDFTAPPRFDIEDAVPDGPPAGAGSDDEVGKAPKGGGSGSLDADAQARRRAALERLAKEAGRHARAFTVKSFRLGSNVTRGGVFPQLELVFENRLTPKMITIVWHAYSKSGGVFTARRTYHGPAVGKRHAVVAAYDRGWVRSHGRLVAARVEIHYGAGEMSAPMVVREVGAKKASDGWWKGERSGKLGFYRARSNRFESHTLKPVTRKQYQSMAGPR